jgi:hypothetical protein
LDSLVPDIGNEKIRPLFDVVVIWAFGYHLQDIQYSPSLLFNLFFRNEFKDPARALLWDGCKEIRKRLVELDQVNGSGYSA